VQPEPTHVRSPTISLPLSFFSASHPADPGPAHRHQLTRDPSPSPPPGAADGRDPPVSFPFFLRPLTIPARFAPVAARPRLATIGRNRPRPSFPLSLPPRPRSLVSSAAAGCPPRGHSTDAGHRRPRRLGPRRDPRAAPLSTRGRRLDPQSQPQTLATRALFPVRRRRTRGEEEEQEESTRRRRTPLPPERLHRAGAPIVYTGEPALPGPAPPRHGTASPPHRAPSSSVPPVRFTAAAPSLSPLLPAMSMNLP
jgi:hypothetical protein